VVRGLLGLIKGLIDMSNNSPIFLDLEKHDVDKRLIEFLLNYSIDKKELLKHKFTSEIHYKVFQHVPYYLDHVIVSKNYIVLCFYKDWKIKSYWSERTVRLRSNYVIGINTDRKLFINKLETVPYEGIELGSLRFKNGKEIPVYFTEDFCIYGVLGYEYDLETTGLKTIPVYVNDKDIYRNYRVQGDLVLTVETVDKPYDNYISAIKENINDQLFGTLIRIILERISNILNSYGFTVETRGNTISFECLSRRFDYDKTKEAINKIGKLLEKELYVKDIANNFKIRDIYSQGSMYSYGYREDWEILIDIGKGRGVFGSQYEPIEINVHIANSVIEKFLDYIVKDLNVSKDNRVVYHGRHKIRYYGYPSRFTIVSKLPLLDLDGSDNTFVFNVNLPVFYISEGDISVEHIEHGTMKYKILKDIIVSFDSTSIHRDNDVRFNHYALKTLKV
jgi:hypothetical protein